MHSANADHEPDGHPARRSRRRCLAVAAAGIIGFLATFVTGIVRNTPGDDEIILGLEIACAVTTIAGTDLFARRRSRTGRAAEIEWPMGLGGDMADFCRRHAASDRPTLRS